MAQTPDRILDELLVIGCQRGEARSFERLVARWHERLRRHAWYLTHDAEATSEVVQEAWVEITRSIGRLNEPTSFRGWAFRIVSNKAADWVRSRQRQRTLQNELQQTHEESATELETEDRSSRVRQLIRELPSASRQILSLKYLDNLSTQEIASALAIPVGTVKSRLFHAREQLREKLERTDNERS